MSNVRDGDSLFVKSQFPDASHSLGKAALQLFLGLTHGVERKTGKRDHSLGVLAVAVQEIIVPCPAEPGVLPGKPADDTAVNVIPVHGLKEVSETGHPSFFVSINELEPFITTAECLPVLCDLFRKEVGMGVDDHNNAFSWLEACRGWVEELGGLW